MRMAQAMLCILIILWVWAGLAAASEAQQVDSSDEVAIRTLMDKISLVLKADTAEKGVEIMRSVISDKSYVSVIPVRPSEALVADKKVFCEALAQSLRDGPRWGTHEVRQIIIVGPIAYEIGESRGPNQDPGTPGAAWLNVFAREDVGWRLVFSTPADSVQKALRRFESLAGESAK